MYVTSNINTLCTFSPLITIIATNDNDVHDKNLTRKLVGIVIFVVLLNSPKVQLMYIFFRLYLFSQ